MSADGGLRLKDIAARLGGELLGDGETVITQVAPLGTAGPQHLSFLANGKYRHQLATTCAAAVIVGPGERDATALPRIVAANPYLYFAKVSRLLNADTAPLPPGIHPSAMVASSARVAGSAAIGAQVVVGEGAVIGAHARLFPGCILGEGAVVGEGTVLYPNVTVYHGCVIGARCILHAGSVVGSDGFGLAPDEGRWLKIPQIGRVVIGDDVEIGANTTIDRGALDDTVIEDGVKLDNLIQVAHNVRIGAHTAIAACVGIAGSARIGRHCTIGGAAVVLGHLEVADHVNISAGTLITKSVTVPGTYTSAMPFAPHGAWLKNAAHLRHLDAMAERIKQLEARLEALERERS